MITVTVPFESNWNLYADGLYIKRMNNVDMIIDICKYNEQTLDGIGNNGLTGKVNNWICGYFLPRLFGSCRIVGKKKKKNNKDFVSRLLWLVWVFWL